MFSPRKFLIYLAIIFVLVLLGASRPVAAAAPGDVVVNEIMQNPNAVADGSGEWLELYNATGSAIDINGWTIADAGIDSHVINNGGPLLIPAGGFLVLGNNTDTGTNGGVTVDYSYGGSWFLGNSDDEVILSDSSLTEVDRVEYDGGANFPDPAGASMALISTALDNNVGANWCEASTPYGDGDLGTPGAANDCGAPADPILVINEIDYDQPSTDTAEYVEIKNAGPAAADLDNVALELINGTGGGATLYQNFDLPAVMLAPGDYYVVCGNAANVPNCDLDVSPDSDLVQNGAPDAVALRYNGNLMDTVSYEGDTGAPYTEGSGVGLLDNGSTGEDNTSISRCSDGTDTNQNNVDLVYTSGTPGATNDCGAPADPVLVINEIDYDQPSTDTAEYVEIKNVGSESANLDNVALELVNGTGGGATLYQNFDLPAVMLAPGDYYVVCGNAANVANCDLDVSPDTDLIQNGAPDAAALRYNGNLLDTVSYEGDTGAPYTEGSGTGLSDSGSTGEDNTSISRCPDGTDTNQNNVDLVYTDGTPGAANACSGGGVVLINEVDADQAGTDSAEFVELYDGGSGNTDLTGMAIVLYNGSNDQSYGAFDLDGFSTDANGYFVLCGDAANVANCDLDVTPNTDLIQNGQDAVALYTADAAGFPNGTAVTTVNLVDALVYDTNDADDPGLLVLLNAGQPQIDEGGAGDATLHSNQRCPNGSGGARNTDTYAQWEPTPGEENVCQVVEPPLSCDDASVITFIHDIQGIGLSSPLVGSTVVIDGVVVGDFQNNASADNGDLNGFYVQEEDADADANTITSEGIFVFAPGADDVSTGDHVRVRGDVAEFSTSGGASLMTELSNVTVALCTTAAPMPTATEVSFPVNAVTDLESYEGMLVTFPQALSISEYFNFDRFNEVVLTLGRHYQGTAIAEPGAPANQVAADNALARITLDDGRSTQNSDPAIHPNGSIFDLTNLFRGGDTVEGTTGVIDDTFGLYRIQPTGVPTYTAVNNREVVPPPVGGTLKVASFNVLNYFTTLDTGAPICGPASNQDCRGANDANEFTRQRTKILAALADIDADIFGLIELENHVTDEALIDLVDGLNDLVGAGTYDYIDTGTIGTDAIKQAFIYKTSTVTPLGSYEILDSSDDPRFIDTLNRPVLAQTFMQNSNGAVLTVAVNHLKSKGSDCNDVGDPDIGDGQGNCNLTRLGAAQALVDWLESDPTGSGDPDFLIIGDLNSYDKEDPIDAILAGSDDSAGTSDDYTDLSAFFNGELAYSYVFDGQLGYLDYALGSASLTAQVTGVTEWHINADEPDLLDYNTDFKLPPQQAIYEPNAFRSSDHDPIIVGLDLGTAPVCGSAFPSRTNLFPVDNNFKPVFVLGVSDPDGGSIDITITGIFQDEPVDAPGTGGVTGPDGMGVGFSYAQLRAERVNGGNGRVYHVYFTATDEEGLSCDGEVIVGVPVSRLINPAVDDGPIYDSTADLP